MEFAKVFAALLEERGWSQVEAARQLGIPQSRVSNYLAGKTEPWLGSAVEIARTLGVSLDDLAEIKTPTRGVIREAADRYAVSTPPFLETVRRRWQRRPQDRPQMELAVRVLWGAAADQVLA